MGATAIRSRVTEEWSFLILRALAMIGGVIALFLVPHPPEHAAQLLALAWAFILYKAGLFAVIWGWPRGVRFTLVPRICRRCGPGRSRAGLLRLFPPA